MYQPVSFLLVRTETDPVPGSQSGGHRRRPVPSQRWGPPASSDPDMRKTNRTSCLQPLSPHCNDELSKSNIISLQSARPPCGAKMLTS